MDEEFWYTDTVLSFKLDTIISGFPSPFKSPTATALGLWPVVIDLGRKGYITS
jgi:hypothetical protein